MRFYNSSTCGLAEELAGDEKKAKPATSSCGNVSASPKNNYFLKRKI
jgi:hypothetical protein